jgi:hypothetical protein
MTFGAGDARQYRSDSVNFREVGSSEMHAAFVLGLHSETNPRPRSFAASLNSELYGIIIIQIRTKADAKQD